MKIQMRLAGTVFLAGLLAGCSGMGTTMTRMNRLKQNKGYEILAELPCVATREGSAPRRRIRSVSIGACIAKAATSSSTGRKSARAA